MPKSTSGSCCDDPKHAVAKGGSEMGLTRHAGPVKRLPTHCPVMTRHSSHLSEPLIQKP